MTDIIKFAEMLAEELHDQADERQQRAMNSRAGMSSIEKDESDAWAVSFSASYQVLRGIALALDKAIERVGQS